MRNFSIGLTTGAAIMVALGAVAQPTYVPAAGYVPDAKTAIRIAKAVLSPVYGEAKIEVEEPFSATLKGGTWTVEGHLPDGYSGGVAIVEISKADARIIRMNHGR